MASHMLSARWLVCISVSDLLSRNSPPPVKEKIKFDHDKIRGKWVGERAEEPRP